MALRATRFGIRDENQIQQPQQQQVAAKAAGVVAKRNPLGEIHRRPLQQLSTASSGPAAQLKKPAAQLTLRSHAAPPPAQPQPAVQECNNDSGLMEVDDAEEEQLMAKYHMVKDVDTVGEDSRDAQLVSCYAKEIFSYLLSLEPTQPVRRDYLCQPSKQEITPRMHRILFDWLVQVHQRYDLLPETLYMALHIVDYYMTLDSSDINKGNYQLLGVAALFLSAKYEEIYPPEICDFVFLTGRSYTESQVRSMERNLLVRLDYFFGYPQPILFLRRYSRISGANVEVHDAAKFLAELGRTSYELVHLPPSGLAAAAFCLAVELLAAGARLAVTPREWLPELEVFSGYSKAALLPALRLLAKVVLRAYSQGQKYTAVRKKYESRTFQMVSSYPEFTDTSNPVLLEYAGGDSAL